MRWVYWLLNIRDTGSIEGVESWELLVRSALPAVLLAMIVLAGIAVAALNFTRHIVLRGSRRFVLAALRLAGLAIVLVLVLQVEANLVLRRARPPKVAVLVDTSESMSVKDVDGRSRFNEALRLAQTEVTAALGERARLLWYGASWRLTRGLPAADTQPAGPTDIGSAVQEAIDDAGSPAAVLVISDGKTARLDRLVDAACIAKQSGVAVFGIWLGGTGPTKAVSVRVTEADAYVRLGDELSLAAEVRAQSMGGQTVDVMLFEDDVSEPRLQQKVTLADRAVPVVFRYRPRQPGRHRYRIEAGRVKGAQTDLTNVASTVVDVIDEPIRVLYVEGTPRFELKFLNIWLARDPVIDLTTVTRMPRGGWFVQGNRRYEKIDEGFPVSPAELFEYDVLISGDIPRSVFRQGGDLAETKLMQVVEFVVRRGGGLITLGGQAVYGAGQYQNSALEQILPFRIGGRKEYQLSGFFNVIPNPAALAHPVMALTDDPTTTREAWDDLPQIDGCNVVGDPGSPTLGLKPAATLLAYRIEKKKRYPVIATHDVGRGRVLSLAIDTTWRWEMQRENDEIDNYRKFWGRAVRYVAADPRTRPGKASILPQSNRPVVGSEFPMVTTLLDATYGPVRNADLLVEVSEPSGNTYRIYPSDSNASPGVYRYSVPLHERGVYKVKATYRESTTVHEIIAGDAPAEMYDAGADPSSLRFLANETGGKTAPAAKAAEVLAALPLTPEQYTESVSVALWNLPLAAALLIAVVCVDCFIRKRNGLV